MKRQTKSRALTILIACLVATPVLAAPKKKKAPKPKPEPEPAAPVAAPEPAPTPAPPPPPTEPNPWAEGVPKERQDRATAIYDEGNLLFAQQKHVDALAKYKEAIALWDHPLIRFNMAVTEIRLDRVLEAADNLEKALLYGDKPFKHKPALFEEAQNYQTLVKGRVGYVEATCDQAGTKLQLDGKPWFDCPGTKQMRMLTGEHAITAEKEGFLTSSQNVVVVGGQTVKRDVKLVPIDSAVVMEYPYRRWIPWTTMAVGFGVGLGGVGTWFLGKNQMDQFEADFSVQCQNGCEPGLTDPSHRSLAAQRDSAELKGKIGIVMIGVGGAVAVTGVVLAILNRPKRVLPNVEVAPTSGGAVTSVGWHF